MLLLIHHVLVNHIGIEFTDSTRLLLPLDDIFGVRVVPAELPQQLAVDALTIVAAHGVGIALLGMDVQDVEETGVAHQEPHANHRPVGGSNGVVLQHTEGRAVAEADCIHFRKFQQAVAERLALSVVERGDAPHLKRIINIVAQRLAHTLTDTTAQKQRDGKHDDGENGLQHHQHMAPMLTHTAAEGASHNIHRLIAAEDGGRHKASQGSKQDDAHGEAHDGYQTCILQQVHRAVGHLNSLVLQDESYEVGYGKRGSGEGDALADKPHSHLPTLRAKQSPRGHLFGTLRGERHAEVDIIEDGEHQYKQGNHHVESGHVAAAVIQVVYIQRTVASVIVERRKRRERQLLHGFYLVDPKAGLQVVAHGGDLAPQVAALALHQVQHATGRIVHGLDVGRGVNVAQVLHIDDALVV